MASLAVPRLQSLQDEDALSDVVLRSGEMSRQASVSARPSAAPSEDELEEDDAEVDELDEDGDTTMSAAPTSAKDKKRAAAAEASKAKRDRKKAVNSKLQAKKGQMGQKKTSDSIKRFSYLLGQTDLFQHFCDLKAQRDPQFAALLQESQTALAAKSSKGKGAKGDSRRRRSEKEEDAEMLKDADAQEGGEIEGEETPFVFTESPSYVKGGTMRDYQVQGLNWMVGLHFNGINGILADEMGLGKTLQTISFLGYLKHHRDLPGPHLVVVPKSTLENWQREFHHWVPGFDVFILQGTPDERSALIQDRILTQNFEVCITSYEICQREKSSLKKLSWEYIIIDEAHRIKNVDSILSQIVRLFDSRARLLITGTPLQNNLHELWALLNFLLPDVFSDVADFDAWFEKRNTEEGEDAEVAQDAVVKQLHKVLRPFLLRRVKMDVEKSLLPKKESNVYVGMTEMQRKWYRSLLEKDIDAVNGVGVGGKKEGKTRLLNIVMQLRKCCNHPYLFDGAEPGPPFTTDEHLIQNSGKMVVLDKLLKSMKVKGSRVLIFSQMSRVLDILEDYCNFREFAYCRIDGSTAHEDRLNAIDEYNKPDSEKFIFLLTTRAGGLGINLTSADIVVLYDSDWNPQADLQAMDRAHRIGQKKQVYVFRFVTENAVEEKVIERAAQKLRLDQLVIQQGRSSQNQKAASKDELVDMIQHGAQKIIGSTESMLIDDDIEAILSRGEERTAELNSRYSTLGFDDLANFKTESATRTWEGESFGGKKANLILVEPSKRERKGNSYSVDGYYRDAMNIKQRGPGTRGPRGPRAVYSDFQFFPLALLRLQEKDLLWQKREQNFQVPVATGNAVAGRSPEELEKERKQKQAAVDKAQALTEEEEALKEELSQDGFDSWNRKDFQAFLRGAEKFGKQEYEGIKSEIGDGKTVEEVKSYVDTFWKRYTELDDHERMVRKIEEAEEHRAALSRKSALIRKKVKMVPSPLQQLNIVYANQTKGKAYTEEEDRFLLVQLAKFGMSSDDVYDKIKREISDWPNFRFDWFIKSRTPIEIGRRCQTLVSLVEKEFGEETTKPRAKKAPANGTAEGAAPRGRKRKAAADEASAANGSRAGTPASAAAGPSKSKKRK